MTTRVSGSFYVRWSNDNNDNNGSFYGRASTSDTWQSLDNFELTNNATYTFYFSVSSGVADDTYVSMIESDGPSIGVRIPKGTTDSSITVSDVKLGSKHLQFTAARLSGDDPKVQVGWGTGTSNVTVDLTWDGSSWSVSNATSTGTDGEYTANTKSTVSFHVTDSSRNKQTAVLTQLDDWSSSSGSICSHQDLASVTSGSWTFSQSGSSGTSSIYSVNLYDPMSGSDSLSVTAS